MRRSPTLKVSLLAAVFALVAGAADGFAQEQAPALSLADALNQAVKTDPKLELARIDVAIARAAVLAATGIDDWVIDGLVSGSSVRLAGFGIDEQNTFTAEANLTRALPSGGTLSFHAEGVYRRTQSAAGTNENYTDTVTATLTHPLLAGRGEHIARAGVARARLSTEQVSLAITARALAAVRDTIMGYWSLALAQREVEIRKSSLELAEVRLRITQTGVTAGAVAPSELFAVEQAIATRSEDLALAELAFAREAIALRSLIGMDLGANAWALSATDAPAVDPTPIDLEAQLATALSENPTLQAFSARGKLASLDVDVAENGLLPELDAWITIGPSGFSDTFGGALENLVTVDDFTVSAGLSARHTIGNRAAKGAVERNRELQRRVRFELQDAKNQVIQTVVNAVKVAEVARRRIEISQRAIELAEKNIEVEQSRFELGKATNFDVLQRQDELALARLRQVRAAIDYLEATTLLDAATGRLLSRFGVSLDAR